MDSKLKRKASSTVIAGLLFLAGTSSFASGNGAGNGGFGVYCDGTVDFGSKQAEQLILLDLVEGSGYKLPGGNSLSYQLTIP